MVESRWSSTGFLLLIFGTIQCHAAPFSPMASALQGPTSSTEGREGAEPSSQEEYYKYYSAIPEQSLHLGEDFGDSDEDLTEAEKRGRNFLRFGRIPQNFLRFGRGGAGPLQYATGDMEPTEEEKRARNFLRFGRGYNANYLRFGRAHDRNFLRFGRSTDTQNGQPESTKLDDKSNGYYSVQTKIQSHNSNQEPESHSKLSNEINRPKRSAPMSYESIWSAPPTVLTWDTPLVDLLGSPMVPMGPGPSKDASKDSYSQASKRGHARNFYRYGRDPLDLHFLRFGKRSSNEGENDKENIVRYMRGAVNKNFLRFG